MKKTEQQRLVNWRMKILRHAAETSRFVAAARYYIASRLERRLRKRLYALVGGGWNRDQNSGIKNLVSIYGGLGNIWLDRPEHSLRTDYAIAYTYREEDIPDPERGVVRAGGGSFRG